MGKRYRILLLFLPAGLLLTLRVNSANLGTPDSLDLSSELDEKILTGESALTKLEDAVKERDKEDDVLTTGDKKKELINKHSASIQPKDRVKRIERNTKSISPSSSFSSSSSVDKNNNSDLTKRVLPSHEESLMMTKLGLNSPRKDQRRTSKGRTFFTINSQQETWGSHPIGSKESFAINQINGSPKWVAYFYDQAVAAVLQTENGTMLKCTVQENIQKWEQEAALEYLGEIMPLQPIPFNAMVHLVTLCGTLNMPNPPTQDPADTDAVQAWWSSLSTSLQGILPGTLWCGMQDRATYYRELGTNQVVDNCCRAHDHCPIKLSALTTRYGVTNVRFETLSHCSCDLEFFRCLKAARSQTADMIGQLYFNFIRMNCLNAPLPPRNNRLTSTSTVISRWPWPFEQRRSLSRSGGASTRAAKEGRSFFIPQEQERSGAPGRLECVRVDREGGCRKWDLQPKNFTVHLVIAQLGLTF